MTEHRNAHDRYTEAMEAFVAEDYNEAIRLLDEAIAADGTFTPALVTRGAAHLKRNHPEEAVADFSSAIDIDAGNARAHHLRGLAREIQGNDAAAEADFDRALALDPDYSAAYFSRGSLRAKTGNEAAAVDDLQSVAHLSERNMAEFAADNNVWRSRHLTVEAAMETELNR